MQTIFESAGDYSKVVTEIREAREVLGDKLQEAVLAMVRVMQKLPAPSLTVAEQGIIPRGWAHGVLATVDDEVSHNGAHSRKIEVRQVNFLTEAGAAELESMKQRYAAVEQDKANKLAQTVLSESLQHLPGCAFDSNKPLESTGSCVPGCPVDAATKVEEAQRDEALKELEQQTQGEHLEPAATDSSLPLR